MNHSELLAEWSRVSRLVHTGQSPYTVATMLNAAAATRRQLATYMRVERLTERLTGNRSARAAMYAETRRTLELEARRYIAEARNIRINQ